MGEKLMKLLTYIFSF